MDPELSGLGLRQADCLAACLANTPGGFPGGRNPQDPTEDQHNRLGYNFTHLYSSLMLRAVQTGDAIAKALNLPLLGWTDWR